MSDKPEKKSVFRSPYDWIRRFDKDGYEIAEHVNKLDTETFDISKMTNGPNPRFKPVSDGGDAVYEEAYMTAEEFKNHEK